MFGLLLWPIQSGHSYLHAQVSFKDKPFSSKTKADTQTPKELNLVREHNAFLGYPPKNQIQIHIPLHILLVCRLRDLNLIYTFTRKTICCHQWQWVNHRYSSWTKNLLPCLWTLTEGNFQHLEWGLIRQNSGFKHQDKQHLLFLFF